MKGVLLSFGEGERKRELKKGKEKIRKREKMQNMFEKTERKRESQKPAKKQQTERSKERIEINDLYRVRLCEKDRERE